MRLLWISEDGRILPEAPNPGALAHLQLEIVRNGSDGLDRLRAASFEAVVANFPLSDLTAESFLEQAQRIHSQLPVIIRQPQATLADAVRFTRLGAWDCFDGQRDWQELV